MPGVLVAGRVVRAVTADQAEHWIEEGIITGGMIPKVRSAIQAVQGGVAQAVITNLAGVQEGSGTGVIGRHDDAVALDPNQSAAGSSHKERGSMQATINTQEIIDNEHDYVLGVYSRPPFVLDRGEGSTLYDTEGNAYLDCCAGIAVNALGYNDAGIAQAMQEAVGHRRVACQQPLSHRAPCPVGQAAVRDQLCRQGAFWPDRGRCQRRRVQVCPPLCP